MLILCTRIFERKDVWRRIRDKGEIQFPWKVCIQSVEKNSFKKYFKIGNLFFMCTHRIKWDLGI